MTLEKDEVEKIKIVRLSFKFNTLPPEIMRWLGYPEKLVEITWWQHVAVMDVIAADKQIEDFQRKKAEAKAHARRARGRR